MKQLNGVRGMVAAMALGLAGCAMVNDKTLRLVSSKVAVVAIVNEQLLQGDMTLLPDRTGTVSLGGSAGAISSCSGSMRFEASNSGLVDLRCNDGATARMRYSLLSETRGYAYGQTAAGVASLAFGLPANDAQAYLVLPANKKLALNADGILELQ